MDIQERVEAAVRQYLDARSAMQSIYLARYDQPDAPEGSATPKEHAEYADMLAAWQANERSVRAKLKDPEAQMDAAEAELRTLLPMDVEFIVGDHVVCVTEDEPGDALVGVWQREA